MKRRIFLREPVSVALETLRAHKMRSFLMLLGTILSVSTLIVVIALISGVNRYIADLSSLVRNVPLFTSEVSPFFCFAVVVGGSAGAQPCAAV
jgi:hypothetical protein